MSLRNTYDSLSSSIFRLPFTPHNVCVLAKEIDKSVEVEEYEDKAVVITKGPEPYGTKFQHVFIDRLKITYRNGRMTVSKRV